MSFQDNLTLNNDVCPELCFFVVFSQNLFLGPSVSHCYKHLMLSVFLISQYTPDLDVYFDGCTVVDHTNMLHFEHDFNLMDSQSVCYMSRAWPRSIFLCLITPTSHYPNAIVILQALDALCQSQSLLTCLFSSDTPSLVHSCLHSWVQSHSKLLCANSEREC